MNRGTTLDTGFVPPPEEEERPQDDRAETHCERGIVLQQQGDAAEALAAFDRALQLKPDLVQAVHRQGMVLHSLGRLDEALSAFDRALRLRPGGPAIHSSRGLALQEQGRLSEALAAYDRALELKPDAIGALVNRGNLLREQGRLSEALAAYDRALELKPDAIIALVNRGNLLKDQACFPQALAAYKNALSVKPDAAIAYSNYLFCLNYDPAQDNVAVAEAHRLWGEHYPTLPEAFSTYPNVRDPEKTLRIGLVSADFGCHPIGFFVDRVLAAADPAAVQYVCYSERRRSDDLTERLRRQAHGWRSTIGIPDRDLAELIRADAIDILTDLAGHTGTRLGCFRFRPAPVQVHWGGYCQSIPLMDYSLWDAIQVPEGDERWFVERIVRLPNARWCYAAPDYAPAVSEPPALRHGYVTFGSFNNLTKVNGPVISLWTRVLKAVPQSRLLLSWPTLADSNERARVAEAFSRRGLDPRRLELRRGSTTHAGVLGEYSDVDVALDPFPFSGCLTTCEALWMGVPIVTWPQDRPVSRQTQAFLTVIGRTEWIARDAEDYVRIAASLGADLRLLAALRWEQRDRVAASPLCDGPRFARNLEAAYRQIWRHWCSRVE
jgi:predicted O-linked N-acetylglucosamine transferase (SPINDLY family)